MNLIDPSKLEPIYDQDGIVGRTMTAHPNFEIIHMTLEPKADLKPHKTPFDSEFFAHKGNAIFTVGDKEIKANEGTIIACPGEVEHGIRNNTEEDIIVLIVKKFK